MRYEITIGNNDCSVDSFGLRSSTDRLYEVSMILSGICGLHVPGVPIDKDGYPAPSGTIFKDTKDTDEYTWIPFPYLHWDLRDEKDSAGGDKNIYADIAAGVITKDNVFSISNIDSKPAKYIHDNFDKYVEVICKKIITGAIPSLANPSSLQKEELSSYIKRNGTKIFSMSKDDLTNQLAYVSALPDHSTMASDGSTKVPQGPLTSS